MCTYLSEHYNVFAKSQKESCAIFRCRMKSAAALERTLRPLSIFFSIKDLKDCIDLVADMWPVCAEENKEKYFLV